MMRLGIFFFLAFVIFAIDGLHAFDSEKDENLAVFFDCEHDENGTKLPKKFSIALNGLRHSSAEIGFMEESDFVSLHKFPKLFYQRFTKSYGHPLSKNSDTKKDEGVSLVSMGSDQHSISMEYWAELDWDVFAIRDFKLKFSGKEIPATCDLGRWFERTHKTEGKQ